jgi:phage shock protein PspC (stress-responsive transcriptional regulator)
MVAMDSTSPDPAPGQAPTVDPDIPPQSRSHSTDGFFDAIYRLDVERSNERWIGGVAGGVARRLGIDPLLVRGIWLALSLLAGVGLVVYAVAWAFLPDARDRRILVRDAVHGEFHGAMLGAIAFFVIGVNWRFGRVGWWASTGWIAGFFWLCLLAGIAIAIAAVVRARPASPVPTPAPTTAPTTAPSASSSASPTIVPPDPVVTGTGDPWSGSWEPPAPTPPAKRRPPRPPRPARRRTGPGSTTTGIAFGLCLVAGAVVLGIDRSHQDLLRPWLVWGGISLVVLGLGVVVAGLRGRRGGVLTALALVTGLVVVPLADVDTSSVSSGTVEAIAPSDVVHVTDVSTAEDGFAYGAGNLTLDLSDLTLPATGSATSVHVPVRLGAGNLRIIVPHGAEVSARVQLVGGQVTWDVGGEHTFDSGLHASSITYRTPAVATGTSPQLTLDVASAAGNITIEEQS